MEEPKEYNGIVLTTLPDLERVYSLLPKFKKYMPVRRLIFIGSAEVGDRVAEINDNYFGFVNENDIISFDDVANALKKKLNADEVARGLVGWYYQQFLKMAYSEICDDEYYLAWDGDTIPCRKFSMFKEGTEIPYLDVKNEYNEEYFITMDRIFPGMRKVIQKSFISEHMLFRCDLMKRLIAAIERRDELDGKRFYEKIISAVRPEAVKRACFSEFETYGTYVALVDNNAYMLRDWQSFRFCGIFFKPDEISDADIEWIGMDFYSASFEKDMDYSPEYAEFVTNPKYRSKLSMKQIYEAVWDVGAIKTNVVEKW